MTGEDVLTTSNRHPDRPQDYPPSQALIVNSSITASRISMLLKNFGEQRKLTSGYRPPEVNAFVKGAIRGDKHETCEAGDIEDFDGRLAEWCLKNEPILDGIGLWMEDPRWTRTILVGPYKQRGWVHLQTVSPPSGNRVFIPYPGNPPTEGVINVSKSSIGSKNEPSNNG